MIMRNYFFAVALMLLCFAPSMKAQFAGGTGTASDPYLVSNRAQLEALDAFSGEATSKDKHFLLTADIDLSDGPWTPIATLFRGTEANLFYEVDSAFHGKLDGANHKILHLNTVSNHSPYVGLFGSLGGGASISNLHIEGDVTDTIAVALTANINYPRTGAIAGCILLNNTATEGVTITNCSNNIYVADGGLASNTGHTCGGLVGEITNNKISAPVLDVVISQCSNTGNVRGGYFTGGIVGRVVGYVLIENCYFDAVITNGPVNGSVFAGGIVGVGNEAEIHNCYAAGAINNVPPLNTTRVGFCGGIINPSATGDPVVISNSVALQSAINFKTATRPARPAYRIKGHDARLLTRMTNNYGNSAMIFKDSTEVEFTATGATIALDGADGADVTLATAKTQAFYAGLGWNFTTVWQIEEGVGYPTLKTTTNSGIKTPVIANKLKASAAEGVLTVTGLTQGEKVNVYTALGQLVTSQVATGSRTTISLPTSGIYVVSSGAQAIKTVNQ
jgi:hypothetical protein